MPVQFGFPPEAATADDQAQTVPPKTLLDILAEKRASKKDGTGETQETLNLSPPPGNKKDNVKALDTTPDKVEAPAPKKRSASGRASTSVAKKAKDSRL